MVTVIDNTQANIFPKTKYTKQRVAAQKIYITSFLLSSNYSKSSLTSEENIRFQSFKNTTCGNEKNLEHSIFPQRICQSFRNTAPVTPPRGRLGKKKCRLQLSLFLKVEFPKTLFVSFAL